MTTGIIHLNSFKEQKTLIDKFGIGNAHLVWVMSMYLDEPSPLDLGVDCLTDQPNDKKLDLIYLDIDNKRLAFAQGYYSTKKTEKAPANKASDLNTAAAWLVSGDLSKVPNDIADSIRECRRAIDNKEIDQIELLYVHNLTESTNVREELDTARSYLQSGLSKFDIQVSAKELGIEECERLFVAKESAIIVRDELTIPTTISFKEHGPNWKAAVISLPASWLFETFHKYGQPLFSANYRGFLGVNKRRKINNGIRSTAETNPNDFWVFNNGITILCLDFKEKNAFTAITGCSIINGAQTTGSIGSIDRTKIDLSKIRILTRLVSCKDQETVRNIVRFNNTQNEITTWDQYSNTETQKRLLEEFKSFGHTYSLKRGFGESISGLGIEVVAQPLISFEGAFEEANRGKNGIFDRKALYNKAFEGKSARHILFVYSLAMAIDTVRLELKQKHSTDNLIRAEEKQLRLARHVRFKYFFISVIATILESLLNKKVDVVTIGFNAQACNSSKNTLEELANIWVPVVKAILPLMTTQIEDDPGEVFNNPEHKTRITSNIEALILATTLNTQFKGFAELTS